MNRKDSRTFPWSENRSPSLFEHKLELARKARCFPEILEVPINFKDELAGCQIKWNTDPLTPLNPK